MHWIDPDHLPEISGVVDLLLVNKHGEADGFLLTDGGEVHVPPHLSSRLVREVRPGSRVSVRGVRPRGVRMVAAVAVDTEAGRILDDGPDGHNRHEACEAVTQKPMTVQGIVKQAIHGPKGETRGAVLEDGRIVRFPPHEAGRLSELVMAGAQLCAHGEATITSFGTVIEARKIGASVQAMEELKAKKPDPKTKVAKKPAPKHHAGH